MRCGTDSPLGRVVSAVCLAMAVDVVWAQATGGTGAAADRASSAATDASDAGTIDITKDGFASRVNRDTVYRNDLIAQRLVPVPRSERKAGHVYFRFHSGLARHVWSIATADGGFRYALGPGSVQQTRQFDPRASTEERQRALQARAPEMARLLEIQGTLPTVILGADERWNAHVGSSVTSVFDLDTGRRWEWHGIDPVGVIHSGGPRWARQGSGYGPVDPVRPPVLPVTAAFCPCP